MQDNWTALLNASQNGNLDIVRILVERDAQIDHYDCVSRRITSIRIAYHLLGSRDNSLRSCGQPIKGIQEWLNTY